MADPQNPSVDSCALCREMSAELSDIVSWLADGELSPEQFAATVLDFEKRKLARLGFSLTSAISSGLLVHFSLRFTATGQLCASMDADPHTGSFEIQSACG